MPLLKKHNEKLATMYTTRYKEPTVDDVESKLKGAKEEEGKFVLEVENADCNQAAADGCPASCIHVEE